MSNIVIPDGGTIGSASDTDAITISSTGKVTTADSELNVKAENSGTTHTFTVKGVGEDILEDDESTVVDGDSGQFAVYNGSTKLFGITEHGYVLKPNHPVAFGNISGTKVSAVDVIDFSGSSYNGGITVTNATGRFTVPVDGWYFVGFHTLMDSSATAITIEIRKNSSGQTTSQFSDSGTGHTFLSAQTPLNLSANDYVDFNLASGTTHNNTSYGRFYIYLIG